MRSSRGSGPITSWQQLDLNASLSYHVYADRTYSLDEGLQRLHRPRRKLKVWGIMRQCLSISIVHRLHVARILAPRLRVIFPALCTLQTPKTNCLASLNWTFEHIVTVGVWIPSITGFLHLGKCEHFSLVRHILLSPHLPHR